MQAIAHYPSLLLVFSADKARFWRLTEDTVEEIACVDDQMDKYTDREGAFVKKGQSGYRKGGEPDVMNVRRFEALHHHLKHVAETLAQMCRSERFQHVTAAATKNHTHELEAAVARYCPGVSVKVASGDYIHVHNNEIRDLFHKILQPQ